MVGSEFLGDERVHLLCAGMLIQLTSVGMLLVTLKGVEKGAERAFIGLGIISPSIVIALILGEPLAAQEPLGSLLDAGVLSLALQAAICGLFRFGRLTLSAAG